MTRHTPGNVEIEFSSQKSCARSVHCERLVERGHVAAGSDRVAVDDDRVEGLRSPPAYAAALTSFRSNRPSSIVAAVDRARRRAAGGRGARAPGRRCSRPIRSAVSPCSSVASKSWPASASRPRSSARYPCVPGPRHSPRAGARRARASRCRRPSAAARWRTRARAGRRRSAARASCLRQRRSRRTRVRAAAPTRAIVVGEVHAPGEQLEILGAERLVRVGGLQQLVALAPPAARRLRPARPRPGRSPQSMGRFSHTDYRRFAAVRGRRTALRGLFQHGPAPGSASMSRAVTCSPQPGQASWGCPTVPQVLWRTVTRVPSLPVSYLAPHSISPSRIG